MDRPQRIISLLSSATEILAGLQVADRLQATSHECDFPPALNHLPRVTRSWINSAGSSQQIDDEVKGRTKQGQPLYQLDQEAICQLAPQLIITQAQCDVCSVRYQDVAKLVASRPELAETELLALAPGSLDEMLEDIQRVASAVGARQQAELWIAELQGRLAQVQMAVVDQPPTRVICIEWTQPLMLAGNWVPGLIELAGGQSLLAPAGVHSQYQDWESVVAEDPDVILVAPCGFDLDRSLAESRQLTELPGWQQLSAVRQQRSWVLDGNALLNRSGPRLVDTVEILAHLLHPELELLNERDTQGLLAHCQPAE